MNLTDDGRIWAVRAETMRRIAHFLTEGVTDAQIQAATERQAALRAQAKPKAPGVAVIPLQGLITPKPSLMGLLLGGGGGLEEFRANLRDALADPEVGSIAIDIDSPGGSTDLVTETAAEIRQARRSKPITAVANTMAGSAAYWLASQADEIVVTPSGDVGSIGVFAVHDDFSGFNEKMGVQPTYITAGKYKAEGHPDAPLSDEARADIQQTVDEFYDLFLSDVAKGRNSTPAVVRDTYGEGRMVTAQRAVEAGMADRVDTLERTVSRLATEARQATRSAAAPTLRAEEPEVPEPPLPEPPEQPTPLPAWLLDRPQHTPSSQ